MKYIVKEINQKTFQVTAKYEFNDYADALEYAMDMNETMKATNLRYKCSFEKEKGENTMTEQYTTQEVIDMASELYDEGSASREQIHTILETWREVGLWNVSKATLEKVFDMIVG